MDDGLIKIMILTPLVTILIYTIVRKLFLGVSEITDRLSSNKFYDKGFFKSCITIGELITRSILGSFATVSFLISAQPKLSKYLDRDFFFDFSYVDTNTHFILMSITSAFLLIWIFDLSFNDRPSREEYMDGSEKVFYLPVFSHAHVLFLTIIGSIGISWII